MTPSIDPAILDAVRAALRAELADMLPLFAPSPVVDAGRVWFSKVEAARYLNVSPRSLERAVEQDRLQPARINGGRNVRFHRSSLDAYLRGESISA